jgi:hypothetical protein
MGEFFVNNGRTKENIKKKTKNDKSTIILYLFSFLIY